MKAGKQFRTGVCIGKFYPPHRGHKLLIETAAAQCDHLTVFVCQRPEYDILLNLRVAWLREIHPDVEVRGMLAEGDPNDSKLWAQTTIEWLGYVPDAAFTSENYGGPWTQFMGCRHILVDLERAAVPVSATRIRANPFAQWEYLEPAVRAYFAMRVCVLGAESTGSTTLALALAEKYNTVWVPEYGRDLSFHKLARGETSWVSAEFAKVAREQNRRESALAREANRVLICDTNSFATRLWHERYLGYFSPEVDELAAQNRCDLYLLTGDEIPFVQDGIRDGEHIRNRMHRDFETRLSAQNGPWALLRGSREARLNQAVRLIDALLEGRTEN